MKRIRPGRWWAAAVIALLCIALLAFWQRQAVARLAIVAGARALGHVNLSFDVGQFGASHATLRNVRVTSLRNEPIAEIPRIDVAYNLRDLLPGGRRLYGLEAVDVQSPHLTIIRHPDGSLNVQIPNLNANGTRQAPPLIARARVRNGSIDVINQSRLALPDQRRLYASDLQADANLSTSARSNYRVTLRYGERPDRLYPVRGAGTIDVARNHSDQHWTAPQLPIAGAVNFLVNSSSLTLQSGM